MAVHSCPSCGSDRVAQSPHSHWADGHRFVWWRCENCGHFWSKDAATTNEPDPPGAAA